MTAIPPDAIHVLAGTAREPDKFFVEVTVGDLRDLTFCIAEFGGAERMGVSDSEITLTAVGAAGEDPVVVEADKDYEGADWESGIVVVPLSNEEHVMADAVGTRTLLLRITNVREDYVIARGTLSVLPL